MDDILNDADQERAGEESIGSGALAGGEAGAFVAWVASDDGAAHGRIMLRLSIPTGERDGDAPISAFFPANDNVVWVGDEFGTGLGGAIGREPAVLGLDSGDTLIAWIGEDNNVHGKLYPPYASQDVSGGAVSISAYEALNVALSELTSDGKSAEAKAGGLPKHRAQLQDLGLGNFAILWAAVGAGGAMQLHGSVFRAVEDGGEGASAGWLRYDMEPVDVVAGFAGEAVLVGDEASDAGTMQLSYEVDTGTAREQISVSVDLSKAPEIASKHVAVTAALPVDAAGPSHLAAAPLDNDEGVTPAGGADNQAAGGVSVTIADAVDATGAEVVESRPMVATTNTGEIIIAHMEEGDGAHATLVLNRYGSDGSRVQAESGARAVVVSHNAVADGPAVVGSVDDTTIAVWLEDTGSDYELRGQMFERGGNSIAASFVIASANAASAIDAVSFSQQHSSGGLFGAQFALTWIEDYDGDGYGSVRIQRYGVTQDANGAAQMAVALGRDGEANGLQDAAADADGENDGFSPDVDASGAEQDIVGRDTTSAGLQDGDLAVAWVERSIVEIDGVETTVETISGRVLESLGGGAVFRIDIDALAGFESVNQDFAPQLMATDQGDIVVGWVGNKNGDYVAQIAVYSALGDNRWGIPDQVIDLKDFDEHRPRNFDISIVGDETPNIMVTWRDGGSIYAQRYDMDGSAAGGQFVVSRSSNSGSSHSVDGMDAVGMPDGTFVVVYSEADEDGGDVDIEARIFDLGPAGDEAPAAVQQAAAPEDEPIAAEVQSGAPDAGIGAGASGSFAGLMLGANTDNLVFAVADNSGSGSSGSAGGQVDDELLLALAGADTFFFRDDFGSLSVIDFDIDQDMLEISSGLVDNYDDLWAAIESLVDGSQFDFGSGNVVFLSGVNAAELNASNVRIVDDNPV